MAYGPYSLPDFYSASRRIPTAKGLPGGLDELSANPALPDSSGYPLILNVCRSRCAQSAVAVDESDEPGRRTSEHKEREAPVASDSARRLRLHAQLKDRARKSIVSAVRLHEFALDPSSVSNRKDSYKPCARSGTGAKIAASPEDSYKREDNISEHLQC